MSVQSIIAARRSASMVQEIERGLDELDLGFCHVKWIPDGDKNKKFLYYLANCACLIPIVFIMMFITLILQVLGKSTVVYPGFPMGERLAGNIGMFGGNGLGKSMIEQFWEEVVLLYEKLVQRKCKQHQVKLEKKYYHVFINGSRAKKLMQECEKNDSTGVALYCEGAVDMQEFGKGGPEDMNAVLTKMADERIKEQIYGGPQHDLKTVYDNRAVLFILGTVNFFINILCRATEGVISRGYFVWICESLGGLGDTYRYTEKEDSTDVVARGGQLTRRYATTQKEKISRPPEYYDTCKSDRDKAVRFCAYFLYQLYVEYRMVWPKSDPQRKGQFEYSPGVDFRVARSKLRTEKLKHERLYKTEWRIPIDWLDSNGRVKPSHKTGSDAFIECDVWKKSSKAKKVYNHTGTQILSRAHRLMHFIGLGMHWINIARTRFTWNRRLSVNTNDDLLLYYSLRIGLNGAQAYVGDTHNVMEVIDGVTMGERAAVFQQAKTAVKQKRDRKLENKLRRLRCKILLHPSQKMTIQQLRKAYRNSTVSKHNVSLVEEIRRQCDQHVEIGIFEKGGNKNEYFKIQSKYIKKNDRPSCQDLIDSLGLTFFDYDASTLDWDKSESENENENENNDDENENVNGLDDDNDDDDNNEEDEEEDDDDDDDDDGRRGDDHYERFGNIPNDPKNQPGKPRIGEMEDGDSRVKYNVNNQAGRPDFNDEKQREKFLSDHAANDLLSQRSNLSYQQLKSLPNASGNRQFRYHDNQNIGAGYEEFGNVLDENSAFNSNLLNQNQLSRSFSNQLSMAKSVSAGLSFLDGASSNQDNQNIHQREVSGDHHQQQQVQQHDGDETGLQSIAYAQASEVEGNEVYDDLYEKKDNNENNNENVNDPDDGGNDNSSLNKQVIEQRKKLVLSGNIKVPGLRRDKVGQPSKPNKRGDGGKAKGRKGKKNEDKAQVNDEEQQSQLNTSFIGARLRRRKQGDRQTEELQPYSQSNDPQMNSLNQYRSQFLK